MSITAISNALDVKVVGGVVLPPGFSVEVAMVTPEMAEQMLAANMRNRGEKPRKQAQYARDVTDGAWMLTGQAIQFDWNGEMIDGQNRCRAIIAAGVPAPCLIVRGLDPAVRGVIDTGVARSAADSLAILDGYPNAHSLAALASLAIAWNRGFTWLNNCKPTHREIREWIAGEAERLNRLDHSVKVGRHMSRHISGSPTFWAFAHYAAAESNPDDTSREDADLFFRTTATLDSIPASDPRSVLHRRLTKDSNIRGPAAEFEKRALIFRAWNAWRDGEQLTKLQAPRGDGWTHKNFPRPY